MSANRKRRRRYDASGRTEGERFVPVSYDMSGSAAWRSLSGSALKVWHELRRRYDGRNNGKLTLSLDEAARLLGLGKATAQRAFEELRLKGFLELVKRGRWYGRLASEWRVTDRIYQGHPPTHDWKRWQPDRHPRKSKLGSVVDHIDSTTGPLQHRETASWSATEPVKAVSTDTIGAETDHLYTNVARDGVCLEQGRRAEPAGERSAPTELRPIANILESIFPSGHGTRAAINSRKS